jgi:BirA family biotin operon repressor/biotin-[acetyl-CoA-carboxylase] ligase
VKDPLTFSDTISEDAIRKSLHTACFGQKITFLPTVSSTNLIARKYAREGAAEGTVVVTDYQTGGKGRLERSWWSPPGENLLFSLIFRPSLAITHTFKLTVLSSLAVAEAIRRETALDALIKWPNDVYIRNKKVSGILSELGVSGDRLDYVIIGIGINVNSNPSAAREISTIATSLCEESGRPISRVRLLPVILGLIEQYYDTMKEGNFGAVKRAWEARSLIKGKRVKITSQDSESEGIAESFDQEGFLILCDASGVRRRIVSGDVSLSLT